MNIKDFKAIIKYLNIMKKEAEDRLKIFDKLLFVCKKEIEALDKNIAHFEDISREREIIKQTKKQGTKLNE